MREGAPCALIGAFLGVTSSAVRQMVRRHGIRPVGQAGRAKLYDPMDVFRFVSTADRLRVSAGTCHTPGDRRRVPGSVRS